MNRLNRLIRITLAVILFPFSGMAVTNIVYNSKSVMVNTNNGLVSPVAEVFLTNNGFSPFTVNGLVGLTTVEAWRSGLAVPNKTNILGTSGYVPMFNGTASVVNSTLNIETNTFIFTTPNTNSILTRIASSGPAANSYVLFNDVSIGGQGYGKAFHKWVRDSAYGRGFGITVCDASGNSIESLYLDMYGNAIVPMGLHVGGYSNPGDNNILVDGNATIDGLTTANDSLKVRNYLLSYEYGAEAQSSPYGIAGVTRLPTYTNAISYIALVRQNNQVWGMGIDSTNNLVIGNPTVTTHVIASPDLRIESGHSIWMSSNLNVNGFINIPNGVWDDLMIPGHGVKGGASAPSFATFSTYGNMAYLFAGNQDNDVYFSAQLPNSYMEGSSIVPHIHWAEGGTTGAGTNVVWELVTQWANMGAVFPAGSTNYITNSITGTNWTHQISSFPALSGTGKTVSSMLMCRLRRLASANASDDYNQYAAFLQFDFHFRKDTLGSRTETAK
jgi:hypothetical protein